MSFIPDGHDQGGNRQAVKYVRGTFGRQINREFELHKTEIEAEAFATASRLDKMMEATAWRSKLLSMR
jgi:hypothetical protein